MSESSGPGTKLLDGKVEEDMWFLEVVVLDDEPEDEDEFVECCLLLRLRPSLLLLCPPALPLELGWFVLLDDPIKRMDLRIDVVVGSSKPKVPEKNRHQPYPVTGLRPSILSKEWQRIQQREER